MARFKLIQYNGRDHGNIEYEWHAHKGISEWWYITGTLEDDIGKKWSWQLTILKPKVFCISVYVLMLALTEFDTEKHMYYQRSSLLSNIVNITDNSVSFSDIAIVEKLIKGFAVKVNTEEYTLDLLLDYGKSAVWHCDNGFLKMGSSSTCESSTYYSYTNMPTQGKMVVNGKSYNVKGKSWFDKQGGPFNILNKYCHWEWFSLRFFDNEEIMLFYFPRNKYGDGTYIKENGSYIRLVDYTIKALSFIEEKNMRFSSKWELHIPNIKDEHYIISPIIKGQINLAYYEQLCDILDKNGNKVGLCFVELLPGVYNDKLGINNLIKKYKS